MAYKMIFKEINGDDTFTLPLIAMDWSHDSDGLHLNLYEDSYLWVSELPYHPSFEELPEDSSIRKTYEYIKNTKLQARLTYTRGRAQGGYNKVAVNGALYYNNKYTGIYIGCQYENPIWYRYFSLESEYTGQQILGYNSSKKLFCSVSQPKSTYMGGMSKPGESGIIRLSNAVINPLILKKGKYTFKGVYVGSQKINDIDDKITQSIGVTITKQNSPNTNEIFYPNLWNDLFGDNTPPEYPDQNPDGDNDDSGQPSPDSPIPGDGDTTSDPIPDPPPLPTVDVTDTGFVVIYNPTVIEIRQLAYFMWSGDFADLIKKVFAEPFAALISLKILYSPISKGASQTVWLGNVETNVSMSKVTAQFSDVDMGTININEFFGSFADYAPFTKIQIFLPFIGYKDLNTDEIMNSQLHLSYRVDVYSGACIAFLTITKTIKSTQLNSILYQFDGNCAMEIPFTSNDNSRYVSAILNSAASSALSLANTSTFTQAQPPFMMDKGESAKFTLGSLAPVANGLLDIMSTKPNVQRAGSLAGAVSSMGVKQPYIIIHRPIQHMPANYQHFIGIPLNLSRKLSEVKGYTIISQVFISSQTATDDEITMITELLKSGVIL